MEVDFSKTDLYDEARYKFATLATLPDIGVCREILLGG